MSRSPVRPASLLPGLEDPIQQRLANGAAIVQLPLAQSPLVCLDFWCRAGSAFETEAESGMAHFLEHMVFKGSRRLAAGEFDRRIEALGGNSNAATGFDDVHFHVLIPPEGASQALELLLDLVLHPSLEPEAFAMERQVVLEELAQSEDQPEEVALQRLLGQACPGHAYGLPILGQRQELLRHEPAAMAAFHRRLYGGRNCVLALSGAVGDGELLKQVLDGPLAGLPAGEAPQPTPLRGVQPGEQRIALPRLETARLLMAWWQPPAGDQNAATGADLLTSLLAEGRRSRLVDRLRERLRIVESVDLDLHAMECGGLALLEAVCEPEELPAVRQAISAVWQDLNEQPIAEAEWSRVQRLVANAYRFSLESAGALAGLIGSNALWGRPQSLDRPLELLAQWDPLRLQSDVLPLLDPARAAVLEAVPA